MKPTASVAAVDRFFNVKTEPETILRVCGMKYQKMGDQGHLPEKLHMNLPVGICMGSDLSCQSHEKTEFRPLTSKRT